MRLIRPINLTQANILASDVTDPGGESAPSEWVDTSTYSVDSVVWYGDYVYISLQDSNNNHIPGDDPAWWTRTGPRNVFACLDKVVASQSSMDNSLYYDFDVPGRVDSVALLNIRAATVRVQVWRRSTGEDPDELVYDSTFSMISTVGISDWYSYFFEDISQATNKILLDIPNVYNARVRIDLTNTGSVAALGEVIIGQQLYIGRTQYGSSVGITDFSKKERDAFGGYSIIEKPFSKRGSFNVMINNSTLDKLQETLAGFRATPILYIGVDEYASTVVYGFYKDFSLVIQHFNETQCNLEVEGLT